MGYRNRDKYHPVTGILLGFLACIPLLMLGGYRFYTNYTFNRDLGGYLKRAADANTLELAEQQLKIALDAMRQRGYTQGTTAVILVTPDKDVGFWYNNIEGAYQDLMSLSKQDRGRTEVVNTSLLKLRQTLLDHQQTGETVTCPPGIDIFPNNVGIFWLFWIMAIPTGIALIAIAIKTDWV